MQIRQLLDQVMDELRGAWRFRWLGLAAAWAVCLVGWFSIYTIPDTYEANARVYVDSRGILRPLLQGLAIEPDLASGLDLVRQVLLSRPQLEQVARDTGLDALAKTPEEREVLIRDMQERIAIDAADLRARTTQGEGLYRISFRDHDRAKSIEVVQTMLDRFVENALDDKRTGQESALRFINDQLALVEADLRKSEEKLADFKKRNFAVLPGSQGDHIGRLQAESIDLETARTNLSIAERRRKTIQQQLDAEDFVLFGIDSGATSAAPAGVAGDLNYRIQDLEKQRDELLLTRTEKWPEVMRLKEQIDELKKKRDDELARARQGQSLTGSMSSSLKTNPVFLALQQELRRTEQQIAELSEEVAQRQARVADLRSKVNTVPDIEAELPRLTRDYEGKRQLYQQLLERRETAALSEDVDKSGTVKFRTVEPPSAAPEPVSPDRARLLAAVLVLGLAVAGGVAWLLNQLKPVFHSAKSMEDITGLPVLASISRTWLRRHRSSRRMEVLKFSAVAALLVVTFAALNYLQQPALRQLQKLLG